MILHKQLTKDISYLIFQIGNTKKIDETLKRYTKKLNCSIVNLHAGTKERLMQEYPEILSQIEFNEMKEIVFILFKKEPEIVPIIEKKKEVPEELPIGHPVMHPIYTPNIGKEIINKYIATHKKKKWHEKTWNKIKTFLHSVRSGLVKKKG